MQQLEIRLGGTDCNFLFLFLERLKKEYLEKINAIRRTKVKHNKRLVAISVVNESSSPVWVCLSWGAMTVCLLWQCTDAHGPADGGSRQTKNLELTEKYSSITNLYLIVIAHNI